MPTRHTDIAGSSDSRRRREVASRQAEGASRRIYDRASSGRVLVDGRTSRSSSAGEGSSRAGEGASRRRTASDAPTRRASGGSADAATFRRRSSRMAEDAPARSRSGESSSRRAAGGRQAASRDGERAQQRQVSERRRAAEERQDAGYRQGARLSGERAQQRPSAQKRQAASRVAQTDGSRVAQTDISNRAQAGTSRPAQADDPRRAISRWRRFGVRAVMVVMALGCIIGLLFFLRPTTSDFEKRELTPFPAITVESFLDGSFFSDVSLWFADTYPLREPLVRMDQAFEQLHGIQPKTQMVGGNVQADELPVNTSGQAAPATIEREKVEKPEAQAVQAAIQDNVMNGLYVNGDTAASVYYFNEPAVNTYAAAINACAEKIGDAADIYTVIIPNNSGATLDEDVLNQLGGSDQKQAIEYFYSLMDPRVHTVETYDALREHRDEYTFFRTDHHWTQLGAYYAYVEFCKAKGIEPSDVLGGKEHVFDNFLGSFYGQLQLPAMEANPDVIYAYEPAGTNDTTYWMEDGSEWEGNVIADMSNADSNSKYLTFINGDRPEMLIENPKVTDGSSCLVVKDSYGCAFVPNLVDNYQTIWVFDFRSTTRNIPEFVLENDIQDVIFLNNVTIASTDTAADAMYSLMEGPEGEGESGKSEEAGDEAAAGTN